VLDWEWAHRGEPVEDLAWCEWIVLITALHDAGTDVDADALWGRYNASIATAP
jgi:hypothetical protein